MARRRRAGPLLNSGSQDFRPSSRPAWCVKFNVHPLPTASTSRLFGFSKRIMTLSLEPICWKAHFRSENTYALRARAKKGYLLTLSAFMSCIILCYGHIISSEALHWHTRSGRYTMPHQVCRACPQCLQFHPCMQACPRSSLHLRQPRQHQHPSSPS